MNQADSLKIKHTVKPFVLASAKSNTLNLNKLM